MRQRIRLSIGIILTTVFVVMVLSAVTASAQLGWNPPCAATRIINYTTCTVTLRLRTTPGTAPTTIPPCGTVAWTSPAGLTIHGVFSQAGATRPLMFPGPVAPGISPCGPVVPPYTTPANAWVRGIVLGPPPGCCVDVYFYRNGDPNYPCTIAIFPGTPPCTP